MAERSTARRRCVYCDGANMNAMLGIVPARRHGLRRRCTSTCTRPSPPRTAAAGRARGPVGVGEKLAPFLPAPVGACSDGDARTALDVTGPKHRPVQGFYGNFGMLVRAYAYIRVQGRDGLREVSENAVLNANYLLRRLREALHVPTTARCKHEFVVSAAGQKRSGVRALDIAKRLMDYGFHPPTIYFPLIVHEALMIEPTETETLETLGRLLRGDAHHRRRGRRTTRRLKSAPHTRR